MTTLRCLTPLAIKDEIATATRRVAYAAPGLTDEIASSLILAHNKLGNNRVDVIVDLDPEVCRLGYGTIEGVMLLQERDLPLRTAPGLRIGILIVDDRGWVFSTPALLIEEIRSRENEPNAVAITKEQATIILEAISQQGAGSDKPPAQAPSPEPQQSSAQTTPPTAGYSPPTKPAPEIGKLVATSRDVETVRRDLDQNPPQSFDIARKVRVFNSAIEFVELELIGAQVQRNTVSLPKIIFAAIEDDATKRRINAAYKLIDPAGGLSGRVVANKVNDLRKDALKPIPQFGQTINRVHRAKFQKDVEKLQKELEDYQRKLKEGLETDLSTSKESLITALVPVHTF